MSTDDKDLYFVAVKIFLENDRKLLIFKDGFGKWDLPGGRLKKGEFNTPLEEVVRRKMAEELGHVKYKLGKPIVFMRHERVESTPDKPTVRIFAVGYQATLESGKMEMTSHHTKMLWVDLKTFKPEDYFSGGWLKGVQEYLELKKNE